MSNRNSSKHLDNATETLNSQKPIAPKPPLYKKATESTSNKKHPINQNRKSNSEKQIPATLKSSVVRKNPSKKVKTAILTKEKTKHTKSSFDTAVLSLRPTDSSDNEGEMCVASDSSTTDTFI